MLEPGNGTLFGKRILAHVMKLRSRIEVLLVDSGPTSSDRCPRKRHKHRGEATWRRGRDGKDTATLPRLPGTPRTWKRQKAASVGHQSPAWTSQPRLDISTWSPELAENTALSCKPLVWGHLLPLPQDTHTITNGGG